MRRLGLGAVAMVEERWWLGFGERGEGDGVGREERETLEREREGRDREALRLFFLDRNDYIASLLIVLGKLVS